MDEINDIDQLDRQLREAAPYIDDDGFTRRVFERLPARRSRLPYFRAAILFGATLLASVMAYLLSDGGRFVSNGIVRLAGMSPITLLLMVLVTGAVIMSLGIAAAFSGNRTLRS